MVNPFTKHPAAKNQTYYKHFKFAFLTGLRLGIASAFFILHAILPFVPIPRQYNCHDLIHSLLECERW